jgi:hypothetical protein
VNLLIVEDKERLASFLTKGLRACLWSAGHALRSASALPQAYQLQ